MELKRMNIAARMDRDPETLFCHAAEVNTHHGEFPLSRVTITPLLSHSFWLPQASVRRLSLKTIEAMVAHSPFV